jgi:hypothetical protein
MQQLIMENYPYALRYAAIEAFGGCYDADALEAMIDPAVVREEAYRLLMEQDAV